MKTLLLLLAPLLLISCYKGTTVKPDPPTPVEVRLPPYTVVCDDAGRFSYTHSNGLISSRDYTTYKEAEDAMEGVKENEVLARARVSLVDWEGREKAFHICPDAQ